MSFAIKQGLFKLKITDHYAILGVPIDADAKQIRLKYLQIAQKLHPDTCKGNELEKKLASEILSKLVNPAYENLSRKSSYAEYQIVLAQIGQHLAEKRDRITVGGEEAKELLKANDNVELVYRKLLKTLTTDQYRPLEKALLRIALISELNLVYLMLKQGQGIGREEKPITKSTTTQSSKHPTQATATQANNQAQTERSNPTSESRVASYIRRAKEYIAKGSLSQAISELREAMKIEPKNSTCHALIGQAYLRQNQLTMAQIHIKKAYQENPQDPVVLEIKQELDKLSKSKTAINKSKNTTDSSKSTQSSPRSDTSKSTTKSSTNGIFGSLFGSKKKVR
ncbi:DnaJ domain-containing protein [Pleurocapsales cyanobacterium LEGE 06147]|nr:DnaJ domain-containing protein [Pleurocapsales cyanobacterium LEGE 06147]